jgi:tetratricopeptide (TPR) repeat protein
MKIKNCFPILLLLFPFITSAQSTAKEWYNKGTELKKKQDYTETLTAFKNAINKKAGYKDSYYQAGWCSNELEKYDEAVFFLEKYTASSNMDKKNKYNELAYSYYKLQQSKEAIDAYSKVIALFPNNGMALRGMGNVYYELEQDFDKAIQYFEKALEVDAEESKPIYYKLGWLYNDKERYDDAVKILLKAVEYDSEDSGYREELGYAYYMQDQYEFAITQLNKAINLEKSNWILL